VAKVGPIIWLVLLVGRQIYICFQRYFGRICLALVFCSANCITPVACTCKWGALVAGAVSAAAPKPFGKFGVRPIGHVAAGFGNNNLSRNEPTVRGTRIKDHGIRFSRLAGSAILGGLLVFLKVMIMRALIMRRWIRGWILSISDWMKNMALEIDDLRQSINRENQNIKKIRPEAFWPFR
jgi:hypothetical protein